MKVEIEERLGVGRREMSWHRNIRGWTAIESAEKLFRISEDKDSISTVIGNALAIG